MSLEKIQHEIVDAEITYKRVPGSVRLIAVSKVQPNSRVEEVLEKGHLIFGENRVQEALNKWQDWKKTYKNIELHLLGPLQTNKVKKAFEIFDYIHSVDRDKLMRSLANEAQQVGFCPKLFLQVNTGLEPQKSGIAPANVANFVKLCRNSYMLPVEGLMCIPPISEEPAKHFKLLKKISDDNGLKELSMGMSADFSIAIEYGATHVRVGSAIFGQRPK